MEMDSTKNVQDFITAMEGLEIAWQGKK